MTPYPDEGLFEIFSNSFFGYGHYRSPIWFVGPHAGLLGVDPPEITRRLEIWHRRGQPSTLDLPRIHYVIGEDRWLGDAPKLHRIWSKLARTALAMEGRKVDSQVRSFQASELGRAPGRNALIHLLAVEARADAPWPYEAFETPYLRRPDLYAERFTERRARHIARQIQRYEPKTVVFYDVTHRQWWERIAGVPLKKSDVKNCLCARRSSTTFLMVRHPESIGTRNDYFVRCGSLAARLTAETDSVLLPSP